MLLCQKKKQLKERAKMNVKANLPPPRLASSCGKKWNISGKANMALDRPSKQSQSACRKREGLE